MSEPPALHSRVIVADATASPAPLGLLAFGLSTILLNAHNAGFMPLNSIILAMGLFYGGMAQVMVGCMEWKKGSTFGAVAFSSYGCFWLAFCTLTLLPKIVEGVPPADPTSMAIFLGAWGALTIVLFYATFRLNVALRVIFGLLSILYLLLVLANVTHGMEISHVILALAGWEGMLTGIVACYAGLAEVINELHGRTIWPT